MQFLLDGLHEDLNRVRVKPYTASIDSNRRPDEEVAVESWRTHILRNDSHIMDCCFGQLRSHVTCRNCGEESVKFDAYSCLSLPIPYKNLKQIKAAVVLPGCADPTVPWVLNMEYSVPAAATVGEWMQEVERQVRLCCSHYRIPWGQADPQLTLLLEETLLYNYNPGNSSRGQVQGPEEGEVLVGGAGDVKPEESTVPGPLSIPWSGSGSGSGSGVELYTRYRPTGWTAGPVP